MSNVRREARRNREQPQRSAGFLRDRQGNRLAHFQVTEDRPARGIDIGASGTACAERFGFGRVRFAGHNHDFRAGEQRLRQP